METIRSINDIPPFCHTGVGLGNFDGLHIGHMALINILYNASKLSGLQSVVYTFTRHPDNVINKNKYTPLLMPPEKKEQILGQLPIDYLFYEEFDENFARMEPADFVKNILVDKLKIKLAVAGFNYTFGYKGEGNAVLLKKLGEQYGFTTVIVPPIKVNNEIVSSTSIREYISNGKMEEAFYMLGRPYSIIGVVETGYKLGTKLGFPTANITPAPYLLLPSFGVYLTKTLLDGKLYNSITNVGIKPTLEISGQKVYIETHILNFEGSIYRKPIEVYFFHKLRDEIKFKDKNELANQIKSDVANATSLFSRHVV
ncbi:MAG: bifunctional riboflavin kinase/FAD synthetase [Clostridiaceae bacterium]|nr:bifunctional riboflavin kinase/FAD synthetase [Clostridiaceae bacterium]